MGQVWFGIPNLKFSTSLHTSKTDELQTLNEPPKTQTRPIQKNRKTCDGLSDDVHAHALDDTASLQAQTEFRVWTQDVNIFSVDCLRFSCRIDQYSIENDEDDWNWTRMNLLAKNESTLALFRNFLLSSHCLEENAEEKNVRYSKLIAQALIVSS